MWTSKDAENTPSARKARAALAGRQTASRADLIRAGLSTTTIYRLVQSGVLVKAPGCRGLFALDFPVTPFAPVAARFGGSRHRPHGVICLTAAAIIHGLTDLEPHNLPRGIEVAVPPSANRRTLGAGADVIRWHNARSFAADELEWRQFGEHGIHVTTAARTVADLFSPRMRARVESSRAILAMAQLAAESPAEALRAVAIARDFGWEDPVAAAYETAVAARAADTRGMRR